MGYSLAEELRRRETTYGKEYPPGMRGFSANNLWLMRQFYKTYVEPEFLAKAVAEGLHRESFPKRSANLEQPVQEIRVRKLKSGWESLEQLAQEVFSAVPWGHHVELLKKVKDPAAPLELVRLHQITEPAPERTSRYPL